MEGSSNCPTKIIFRNKCFLRQFNNLTDCRFLVGTSPNRRIISGHRMILAMASPVFERMFYGNLPERDDLIDIPDIKPDIFKAMLDYIYTDEISVSSYKKACDLYYVAKKYMLPNLVEHSTNYLVGHLTPKNACHAYKLANLYDQPRLIRSSMKLIVARTREVIFDPSFMHIEASTLMAILDQNYLNIDSELDLFYCVLELANQHGILNDEDRDNKTDGGSDNTSDVVVKKIKLDPVDSTSVGACGSGESAIDINKLIDAQFNTIDKAILLQAVKKIRFLTMTPQQFTDGPSRSKLLQPNEALAILTKLVNPTNNDCQMPEGFCLSTIDRAGNDHNYHLPYGLDYYSTDSGESY